MKLRMLVCAVVVAGASMLITSQVISQDKGPKTGPGEKPDMAAMMAQCLALGQPGDNHAYLNHFVGKWDLTTKMWMDPSAPPSVSKGTAVVKWMLDGRFLHEAVVSELDIDGQKMAFKGFGISGYDNIRNMYTSAWVDNMSTYMMTSMGTRNPSTGVFTYYGQMDEPMTKTYGRTVKWRIKIVNDNKHIAEMFDLAAGENYKVMEITYNRAK